MLAISVAIILGTAGLSWFLVGIAVWHVARTARTGGGGRGPILVLGHRLQRDGQPSAIFSARLDRAAALCREAPGRRMLLLGGASRPGQPSEAAVGRATLLALGIAAERIELEEGSRHTLENLRAIRAALQAGGQSEPPVLVTSRPHLARAALMARGMGIVFRPCAAEPVLDAAGVRAIPREAFLLHWYVTGRLVAWLIRSRRLAARVT
jgi:uncharacterized SAM-binding protein YcdF (DUF218 family)